MPDKYLNPQEWQRQVEQWTCERTGKMCDFGICDECPVTGGDKDEDDDN